MSCFSGLCEGPSLARLLRRNPGYQYSLFSNTAEADFVHTMQGGPGFNDGFNDVPRAESMDISNDPRFFTDSVIDKRLVALGSLVVVSTLLLENAADIGFEMRKRMSLHSVESTFQLGAFVILMGVLLANVLSVYVGVAQPYHTLRLATSGPAGFEASASYYLNKDIIVFRHVAVKSMLLSVPWFVLANGLRMVPKFVWDAQDAAPKKHQQEHVKGNESAVDIGMLGFHPPTRQLMLHMESGFFIVLFVLAAIVVWTMHLQHLRIFQENYDKVWYGTRMSELFPQSRGSMHRRHGARVGGPLDV